MPPNYVQSEGHPPDYEITTGIYECDQDGQSSIYGSQFLNSMSSMMHSTRSINRQDSYIQPLHRARTITANSRSDGFMPVPMRSRRESSRFNISTASHLNLQIDDHH